LHGTRALDRATAATVSRGSEGGGAAAPLAHLDRVGPAH